MAKMHNRRTIRLKGYDYTQAGAYHVTICVQDRKCLFGDIQNGEMVLNDIGKTVNNCWIEIPKHFPRVTLDEYIVMPNHLHGIIVIVGANDYSPLQNMKSIQHPHGTSKTIGSVIRGFKIGVIKWARQNTNIKNIWQRNFYEHIIRNEKDLNCTREYIVNNPAEWEEDEYYPV